MYNVILHRKPQAPDQPQEIPGKENVPKQPEVYPPGDLPVAPTNPGNQPIDSNL